MVISWKDVKVSEISIQPAEDAEVIAADVEDFVALQAEMAVQDFDEHIHRGKMGHWMSLRAGILPDAVLFP
jgi:hypothetical protein